MAGFLYAIANVNTVKAADLEGAGLTGIFGQSKTPSDKGLPYCQRYTTKGPGGQACSLISLGEDAGKLHFKPEQQHWQKSMNDKYWLGFYNDDRPTEKDLRRKRQLAGHEIELIDGGKWLIPIARMISRGSTLPQTLILGKNGEVITEELSEYAEFSSRVGQLWEDFQCENKWKEGEPKLTVTERMQLVIEALAWNYHIGADEVNLLKLITTQNISELLAAIIDVPTLIEAAKQMADEKKKGESAVTGDGLTSGNGAEAS